jgi:hypothetical protein
MTKFPIQYKNGNTTVTIHSNGTKIREWPDNEVSFSELPESCDLKITQYCDLGDKFDDEGNLVARSKTCEFCHEMSNNKGKHGDLKKIWEIWKDAPQGSELAIGGGNPLDHPDLEWFLKQLSSVSVIPNITVNGYHMLRYAEQIQRLQKEKLIYGLGVSYRGQKSLNILPTDIDYSNAVFHVILGVHTYDDCRYIIKWCRDNGIVPKILLLGYKRYGNGSAYFSPEVAQNLENWKRHILFLLTKEGVTISFDNLALDQLSVKNILDKKTWNDLFQGEDGNHTMYLDAVEEKYAKTSTSPIKGNLDSLKKMFANVRNNTII